MMVCFAVAVVAGAGGIGGGVLFVPILQILGEFSAKDAVPISNAMIIGVALGNYFSNLRKKHPEANRPLVDYNLCLAITPAMLLGSVIGVIFNQMFPEWLVVTLLFLMLGYMSIKTTRKGIAMWKQEKAVASRTERGPSTNDPDATVAPVSYTQVDELGAEDDEEGKVELISQSPERDNESPTSDAIVQQDSKIPIQKLLVLVLCLLILTVLSIFRGARSGASMIGVEACGGVYWVLWILTFVLLGLIEVFIARYLLKDYHRRVECGFHFLKSDIRWTKRNAIFLPSFCSIAGIGAGLIGIGGGTIIGPILLALNVLPSVSSSSAALLMVFANGSTVIQYVALGRFPVGYGSVFFALGLVASILGTNVIGYFVKKKNKQSYVVLAVVGILIAATTMAVYSAITTIIHDINSGAQMGFAPPC